MSGAWRWALAAWGRPGVEALCLELQNRDGQCPPLLLWRLWAAETGLVVSADTLADSARTTRTWIATVVEPLRTARRALAQPIGTLDQDARLALRNQVRAAELAAERLLIEALESLVSGPPTARDDATEALVAVASAWGAAVPIDRLAALAGAVARPAD